MPSKTKKQTKLNSLYISKENYDRILMWSLSKKEIAFLCIGTANSIKKVVRLTNISRKPQVTVSTSENHYDFLIKSLKIKPENIIAEGHSHPKSNDLKHPSELDIKWLEKGKIELIAFPTDQTIKAWRIQNNLISTLKNQIAIVTK